MLLAVPNDARVVGPEPICLEGRVGSRYWIHDPYPLTGAGEVDERLAGYPVAVFQPHNRPADETPVVIALQGMAAPYHWNAFLVPTLLDMGIACVLFETPFAGERSLVGTSNGDILTELLPVAEQRIALGAPLLNRVMDVVARDFRTVLRLANERHGLRGDRLALFGVSLGTLFASYAFTRDGLGSRLLGTIGHAELPRFARSYTPPYAALYVSRAGRLMGKVAARYFGRKVTVGIEFLSALRHLAAGRVEGANPMAFANRVTGERRVRFLVGREDRLVKPADAVACAGRFPDGECFVVPGLAHGTSRFGPSFVEHARAFVGTQLGDWRS